MSADRDRSRYFEDLYRLVCDEGLTLEERIERAIEVGRERLEVEHGTVSYTGDGNYEILDTTISTGEFAPGVVTDFGTTWCRHVVDDREMVAFGDANGTEYRDDPANREAGYACYVGAPLTVDGETYGTLCYLQEGPHEDFDEDERQFVTLLAQWISYEIERTKHHRELSAQNERLDEFAGIVAHDLRNPLAGATGYLELALENAEGQQREFLQVVGESLDRMESLIEGLLLLAREGSDVGERVPVSLPEVARDAWDTVDTREASLAVDADATVYADESRLRQLLENLFRNAVEHGSPDVAVTVEDIEGGFAVADDGPGLPEEVREWVFNPAATGGAPPGLGLLIVERIVSGHDWEGRVRNDGGARFEITRVERQ